jgi:hypothetical protein
MERFSVKPVWVGQLLGGATLQRCDIRHVLGAPSGAEVNTALGAKRQTQSKSFIEHAPAPRGSPQEPHGPPPEKAG